VAGFVVCYAHVRGVREAPFERSDTGPSRVQEGWRSDSRYRQFDDGGHVRRGMLELVLVVNKHIEAFGFQH
jgi:hypothetical protein